MSGGYALPYKYIWLATYVQCSKIILILNFVQQRTPSRHFILASNEGRIKLDKDNKKLNGYHLVKTQKGNVLICKT